jgi:hypothetical protein
MIVETIIKNGERIATLANSLVIAPAALIWVALMANGYLPFEPAKIAERDHSKIIVLLDEHMTLSHATDDKVAVSLESIAKIINRHERRGRLVECHAKYKDPKMLDWCLNLNGKEQ